MLPRTIGIFPLPHEANTLIRASPRHFPIYRVKDVHLFGGPRRGKKNVPVAVCCQPLNNHSRRQDFEDIADRSYVLLLRHQSDPAPLVKIAESRSLQGEE